MRWRSGRFDRSKTPKVFHPFVPAHAANNLFEIDLEKLQLQGKRLILLDVDHTIVKWKAEEFAAEILDWISRAKALKFDLCILSNTRRPERLQRLSAKLDIPTVKGKFKPSREMYRLALMKFKRKPEEAIMIGDQLMTDILGANRSGIEAIWVRKMDGKEFAGTRLNRLLESFFKSFIYKGLITPIDESGPQNPAFEPIADRPIMHQLVKFGVVGVSSFIIDFGVRWFLTFHMPWGDGQLLSNVFGSWLQHESSFFAEKFVSAQKSAVPFFVLVSSILAIINSFIWNRLWTFEIRGKQERMKQFRRFIVVAGIGMIINVIVSSTFANIIPGDPKRALTIATLIATVVAAVWNFYGQRKYAFKPEPQ